MGYVVKTRANNGVKFVEFTGQDGKRKRVSLNTRDPKAAEQLARDVYLKHFTGQDDEPAPKASARPTNKLTLGAAFDRMKRDNWSPENCSSWATVWSDADILLRSIGDIPVEDIQYEHLKAYADEARAAGHAAGTIKKRLSRVRTLLNLCATAWIDPKTKRPYISYVPAFPKTGQANKRKAELLEEDERRVLEYCDQRRTDSNRGHQWWLFKQFIMWQIDTGMRKGETLSKTLADIKGDLVKLYDGETKNGEGREVPLTTRLQKVVAAFRAMDLPADKPFFEGLNKGKIFEMWDECREALALGDVTIHDLRHTRGQRLVDSGVPLEVVADLLGHKDIKITASVYTFRKTETLRKWTDHAERGGELRAVS